ncbi:hypothetical protein [Exiguobacterium sp. s146]|uniref:hypothetical protein n=1 Tax=Exiguobacterium sp. s146 TaxID=2751223 RepID=UPI001BEBD91E|nr:hypothetical protein [Exiguobacterium sp. s146]
MNESLFIQLLSMTFQSFSYWMFATLFIALAGYVVFYMWDREFAIEYRTLWRKFYYLTFAAFVLFGLIVEAFTFDAAWALAGIAIVIAVLDFGVLVTPGKEPEIIEIDMTKPLTEEQ